MCLNTVVRYPPSQARSSPVERVKEEDTVIVDGDDGGGVRDHPVTCKYYEGYQKEGSDTMLPPGVYDVEEMLKFGEKRKWCPYYTARHALNFANVVVYNYQYLLVRPVPNSSR